MEKFNYIDHLSDIGIEFYGDSLEELFENAAAGMFSIICNPGNIDPVIEKNMVIREQGKNPEDLLILWLEELLYIFDVENIIFTDFKINSISGPTGSGGFVLKASAKGEKVDFARHDIKVGIKAPTYHKLGIIKEEGKRWTGSVVFDV